MRWRPGLDVLEREGGSLAFSRVSLLAQAQEVAGGQVPLSVLADTIQTQIREGALIARGGGRAVASGDTDQLQAIAPGQPFHLQQTRSAADVAIMKEIVRQTPALRPAVYSLIARDVAGALETVERISPQQVPRQAQAWFPPSSVMEIKKEPDASPDGVDAVSATLSPPVPATLHDAIVADYLGRTPQARDNTLIITHLNQDRRAVNALIHDARVASGELSREERPLPILVSANIPEGALRRIDGQPVATITEEEQQYACARIEFY